MYSSTEATLHHFNNLMKPVQTFLVWKGRKMYLCKGIKTVTMSLSSRCRKNCNNDAVSQSVCMWQIWRGISIFLHQAESSRDGQRGEQTSISVPPPSSQHQLRELLEAGSRFRQTPREFRTQSENETPLITSLTCTHINIPALLCIL